MTDYFLVKNDNKLCRFDICILNPGTLELAANNIQPVSALGDSSTNDQLKIYKNEYVANKYPMPPLLVGSSASLSNTVVMSPDSLIVNNTSSKTTIASPNYVTLKSIKKAGFGISSKKLDLITQYDYDTTPFAYYYISSQSAGFWGYTKQGSSVADFTGARSLLLDNVWAFEYDYATLISDTKALLPDTITPKAYSITMTNKDPLKDATAITFTGYNLSLSANGSYTFNNRYGYLMPATTSTKAGLSFNGFAVSDGASDYFLVPKDGSYCLHTLCLIDPSSNKLIGFSNS